MKAVINKLNTPGTTSVDVVRAETDKSLIRQSISKMSVLRKDVPSYITEYNSELRLIRDNGDIIFSGVITQQNRKEGLIEFVVQSYERYAKDASPVPALTNFEQVPDTKIIKDLIRGNKGAGVDQLNAPPGTLNSINSEITIEFNNISVAKCIRKISEITGGEIKYSSNKNIVYQDKLGEDKTSTVLSPSNKNTSSMNVNRRSGDQRATHIRMLGASSGPSQVTADIVADGYDPTEDREVWTTEIDKSINKSSLLKQKGQELINEKYDETIEISATVRPPEVVNLGDKFTIDYQKEGIDSVELRAVGVKQIFDSDGERYKTKFSTIEQDRRSQQQKTNKTVIESSISEDNSEIFGLPQYQDPSNASGDSGAIWVTGEVPRDDKGDIRSSNWPPDIERGIFTYELKGTSTTTRDDGIDIIELNEEFTRGIGQQLADLANLNIEGRDLTFTNNRGPNETIFSYSNGELAEEVIPSIDASRHDFSNVDHGEELPVNPDDHHQPPKVETGTLEVDTTEEYSYVETVDIGFRPTYIEIDCIYNKNSPGSVYSEDPNALEKFITSGHSHGIGHSSGQVVNMSTVSPGFPGGNKSYTDNGKILHIEEEVDAGSGSFDTNITEAQLNSLKTYGFNIEWTYNDVPVTATYKAFR